MKRCLIILVGTLLIGFCQNLLQNPGFENWTSGMPDYWFKDNLILILRENIIVHSGNYAVKDSLLDTVQTNADFYQGPFPIMQNNQYNFTIWVYDNDPAGRLRSAISWHTTTGWTNVYSTTYSSNSAAWQGLTLNALSPDGADSAVVLVRAYDSIAAWDGGAVFYLDDACFAPPVTQSPVIARVWHTPINPAAGIINNVYADVTDDGVIVADTLYYGIDNLNNPFKLLPTATGNDTFRYQIPGQADGDTVFYYLKFTDNDGLSTISDTHSYFIGAINIFINEVYYDAPGSDSGCFVELYGPANANLNMISLVGINGNDGGDYVTIDLTGHTIPGDGFFVIAQNSWVLNGDTVTARADLQNGPDNLELRFNNIVIDALGYGIPDGWIFTGEWFPAPDVVGGHCLDRYPDGKDTDNNYLDFDDYDTLTPGGPNPIIGIEEINTPTGLTTFVKNPVKSNINFASLISERNRYPLNVYNSLGRLIKTVYDKETELNLPGGVYFLKLNSVNTPGIKIVVVR